MAHVRFTDETKFSLVYQILKYLEGVKNLYSDSIERERFGRAGFMVMIDGCTPIHVFNSGSVTVERYRDKDVDTYVKFLRGAC